MTNGQSTSLYYYLDPGVVVFDLRGGHQAGHASADDDHVGVPRVRGHAQVVLNGRRAEVRHSQLSDSD